MPPGIRLRLRYAIAGARGMTTHAITGAHEIGSACHLFRRRVRRNVARLLKCLWWLPFGGGMASRREPHAQAYSACNQESDDQALH